MFATITRDTARTPWDYVHSRGTFGNNGVSEHALHGHLQHMIRGFEHESRLRIPRGSLKERVTKACRGDVPEASSDATALLAAWTTFPAVTFATNNAEKPVVVVMHGHICNAQEMRDLYGLPQLDAPSTRQHQQQQRDMNPDGDVFGDGVGSPRSINIEGAQLILELYGRRFEDKDGDPSDQPATALTACEGSFSFVLLDAERDAVLVARSAESDTHPLFWGTASHGAPPSNNHNHHEDTIPTDNHDYNENDYADDGGENDDDGSATTMTTMNEWDGTMLLSSDLAALDGPCGGAAVAFPLGAFYYCDDSMDVGAIQRLSLSASRAKRKVQPLHKVNSSGQVCGLGFYTESGNDLASLAHKYIS